MHKLFLLLLLLSSTAIGQTHNYVSPAGNNTNAGTLLQPWRTAQYALDHATPGCTIYLMGGTYRENLEMTVSGTASQPVTLTSYSGQAAVIDGTNTSGNHLLKISGKQNISVHHLEFANFSKNNACAILIDGNSAAVTISNNRIHDINFSANAAEPVLPGKSAHAIAVFGTDVASGITSVELSSNEIFSCRTGKGHAVEIAGDVENFIVRKNTIYSITNSGIAIIAYNGINADALRDRPKNGLIAMNTVSNCVSLPENAAGILVDGAMLCRIENNSLHENTVGIFVCCSTVGRAALSIHGRNNVIYRNNAAGIILGGNNYPAGCGALEECSMNCNTLFDNNLSIVAAEIVLGFTSNTTVNSNIIDGFSNMVLVKSEMNGNALKMNFNLYYTQSIPEFSWNGNSIFSFTAWQFITHADSSSFYGDPHMVSPSSANLHLEMHSPAIDRGDSLYVAMINEVDMDTMTRVQNGRVDIGADEYGTTVGITNPERSNASMYYELSGTDLIIHFSVPQLNNATVYLFDVTGKTIGAIEAKKGDASVKFSKLNLAGGIYFVAVNGATLKIVQ